MATLDKRQNPVSIKINNIHDFSERQFPLQAGTVYIILPVNINIGGANLTGIIVT